MFKRNLFYKQPCLLLLLVYLFFPWFLQAQCPDGLVTDEHNLIKNGDFEQAEMNFKTDYLFDSVANEGKYLVVSDAKIFCKCFSGSGDGQFLAVDGANGPNKIVWQQGIDVKANTLYFFSAWASNLYPVQPAVLQFSINGQLLGKPFHCPSKQNVWEQFFVNWHSAANTKATITLVSQNPNWYGNDFGLDRIKFYACESSSLQEEVAQVEIGKVIELRNVFFETASAKILPSSFTELDQLATYLKENPTLEIEISGHTDSVGGDEYNLKLSGARANSIGDYLIGKGVEARRLITKGFGKNVPVADNETLEGRQKNRRVEFKILKL